WSGCDAMLITVDALRADHVGAYGYPLPTSPALDALAARGARFEHAYSSAPHTSLSIASMLSGRNVRPLLTRDLVRSTQMWPEHLRGLGYRTAAFYPPEVFNVDAQHFAGLRERAFGFEHHVERDLDTTSM